MTLARKVTYIYRADMRKRQLDEPLTVYMYARNADVAKEFVKKQFEEYHFHYWFINKLGESKVEADAYPRLLTSDEVGLILQTPATEPEAKFAEQRSEDEDIYQFADAK